MSHRDPASGPHGCFPPRTEEEPPVNLLPDSFRSARSRTLVSPTRDAGTPRPSRRSRRAIEPLLESLESRELLTSYVQSKITNNSQANGGGSGLPNSSIYVFFTEGKQFTWTIDSKTGVATRNTAGTLAPSLTLAQLVAAGGAIKVDA